MTRCDGRLAFYRRVHHIYRMYVSLLCINFPPRFIFIFISYHITDLFLHTTHVTLAFIISVACLVFAHLAYMHLTFF